ncbi:MAG: phosphatidylglycerol---prolipoprotein diacylglyceryl transferase [Verrucomicrobiota bacterium]|jgi:phosphatidylglycerol:prolipoprotein diacylglycerol transferase
MLSYYLHNLDPFIFRLWGDVGPRWYGMAYVLAFISGFALLSWLAKRGYLDLSPSAVGDFVTWVALFGVMIGGRIGYVIFYKPEMFREPLSILRVWEGGMSSHGGIIGVVLFSLVYARRHKIPWTNLGDNVVVVAPIGLGLGRLANFINGELYGRIANFPWAMQFPKELLEPANAAEAGRALVACQQIDPSLSSVEAVVQAVHTNPQIATVLRGILTPRHPSQLYEAFLEGLLLFAIMWFVRTRTRTPNGLLTGLFMCCYAIFRIVVEYFREPDAPMIGAFTRGQFFSFFLIAIGVAFIVAARLPPTYPKKQPT